MLFPITLQLLRCLPFERAVVRPAYTVPVVRDFTDENTDAFLLHRLRQTAKPACLGSLTWDGYSVVNGSVWGTRSASNVLASDDYMLFLKFVNMSTTVQTLKYHPIHPFFKAPNPHSP